MKHFRYLLIIIILFTIIPPLQSQINTTSDTPQNISKNQILTFSKASEFFFTTLEENFEGNRAENIQALMKIITKENEEPEDFFRLQVDTKKFKSLNTSLESIYDDFFPIHSYIYEENSNFDHIVEKHIFNRICDTLEVRIPTNMTCYVPRNTFIEGSFKYSFGKQLLNDKTPSAVMDLIMAYLDFGGGFTAFGFSYDSIQKYNVDELSTIYDSEYNRILVSLIFWEYLSDCANYDLNTRKYFYED
ncbi:hypothetical protein [Zobellia roscoffensis]|uniref:hypothetical protein n=1 Tax=Zobellia roscoffensis TaxID=2779508 RepID=UPI00188D396B|nr:hypothetical protein [Zobellia roscoffensis]